MDTIENTVHILLAVCTLGTLVTVGGILSGCIKTYKIKKGTFMFLSLMNAG